MIFNLDKYGNLISSDTTDALVQYSVNANTLYVSFEDIDLKDYLPYVSFERSDGQLSPYIAMAFTGNNISYTFSDMWVTAKDGILKCAITLKQNGVVKKTATFNLQIVKSVKGDEITYIDDVAYNEMNARIYSLETDYVSKTKEEVISGRKRFSDSVSFEGGTAYFDVYAEFNSEVMLRENAMLESEPNEDLHIVNKKYVDTKLEKKVDTSLFQTATTAIIDSLTRKADIEYVHGKFNQLLGEGASETLDTIGEISKALEENIDVVEALDNAVTNKADKSYVEDIIGNLNIYDYLVYNNPEVKDGTLYLENGYVRDGVLYLKNAKVVEGVLFIDYIE